MTDGPKFLGRTLEYDEKYCQMLIDHMAKGYSFESFGPTIGVCRSTLYNWKDKHKAFLDAKNFGTDVSLNWWEKQGIEGTWENKDSWTDKGTPYAARTLNNAVWIFNMKNRHGWKDKPEEHLEDGAKRVHKELSNETLDEKLDKLEKE